MCTNNLMLNRSHWTAFLFSPFSILFKQKKKMIQRVFMSTRLGNPNWKECTYAECLFFLTGCLSSDKDLFGKNNTFGFDSDNSFDSVNAYHQFLPKDKDFWDKNDTVSFSCDEVSFDVSLCHLFLPQSYHYKHEKQNIKPQHEVWMEEVTLVQNKCLQAKAMKLQAD